MFEGVKRRKGFFILLLTLLLVSLLCLTFFFTRPATITTTTSSMVLGTAAAAKGRIFGAAVASTHLSEALYSNTLDSEFTGVTPENEMKWETTEPARGTFNF